MRANLSVMKGELGVCVVGCHPELKENLTLYHSSAVITSSHHIRSEHPAFAKPDSFFIGEEMGIECRPRCGGCKCGKCPVPGHNLSFREEQELGQIRDGLTYDEDKKRWVTAYPWIVDPEQLPNNYHAAFSALKRNEKSLAKDPERAKAYQEQMVDMVQRGAARKVNEEWKGPVFYINHLAVSNPSSNSTPLRIVFNSSQSYQGVSLNSCLAKGPDSYKNSSLGILLRWKEEAVALVGDIKKMFHSVEMRPLEQQCHRFLWRDLDTEKEPDIYVMTKVNMGDKPAPAIATEALSMTAERHKYTHPIASCFIQNSSYVDDLIDSVTSQSEVKTLITDTEKVLDNGGFHIKCWQCSGDKPGTLLKGSGESTKVLGVKWFSENDTIGFDVTLNFSKKVKGERTEPNLCKQEVPDRIPDILTKRLVLQQVMAIYDPSGHC